MNSIPLFVNVTPVPAVNINGFVTVIAISDTVVPGEETESDGLDISEPRIQNEDEDSKIKSLLKNIRQKKLRNNGVLHSHLVA